MACRILTTMLAAAVSLAAAAPALAADANDEFTPLFDGKTLKGWHATPGGSWEVRDGVIVGTSEKSERRHGLLVSDASYGDFVARCTFRVLQGDSGFYFRAEKVKGAVGVHGFQAEVDRSPKVAGLYETGGRKWVAAPDAQLIRRIHTPGEWADLQVTAIGRYVEVRLNGERTVVLKDTPMRMQGHFALQLHGGQEMHVEYKDIEVRRPTDAEVAAAEDGFEPMFNGKDLSGWRTTGNWKVLDDGTVTLQPRPGERGWQRYDAYLTTARKYSDFIIDLEFKFAKGGNSGVFLRVADPNDHVRTGFEVQILDTHGKEKLTAHDCGGIIGTAVPSRNMVKPAGQWNQYTITCDGNDVTVVLNGERIVKIDLSKTGLKNRPPSGYIGFQDEAKRVWYRNVRIKELDGAEGAAAQSK